MEYTENQLQIVRNINSKADDLYAVLNVEKSASQEEISKAYKKLALEVHPDKNQCPGATEAFQALGRAMSILSDPIKRKEYDEGNGSRLLAEFTPEDAEKIFVTVLGIGVLAGLGYAAYKVWEYFQSPKKTEEQDKSKRH